MFADASAVLREAGLFGAANRTERCQDAAHAAKCKDPTCDRCRRSQGGDFLVLRCEGRVEGTRHIQSVGVHCGHRLCASCAPRRRKKLCQEYDYEEGVRAFAMPVLLTLTIQNLPKLWRDNLVDMKACFANLRRRLVWKGHDCHRACVTRTKKEILALVSDERRARIRALEDKRAKAKAVKDLARELPARACAARGGKDDCRSSCVTCPERASHNRCPLCKCVGRRRHDCTAACETCPREKAHGMWHAEECGHIHRPLRYRADGSTYVGPKKRCRCPGEHKGIPGGLLSLEITATEHKWGCPGRPTKKGVTSGTCAGGCTPSWHPHIHVVADATRPISIWTIGEAWKKAAFTKKFVTGETPADIRAIKAGFARTSVEGGRPTHMRARSASQALSYAVKYAAKGDLPSLEGRRAGEACARWASAADGTGADADGCRQGDRADEICEGCAAWFERELTHRRKYACVYARAIENVRLVQPFGNLRARRYHSPGILPACLDCCALLEKSSPEAMDRLVMPLPPAEKGRECETGGGLAATAPTVQELAADPTLPISVEVGPTERVRQHLKHFRAQWPHLMALCPRERKAKRLWISDYLNTWYGIPITVWHSEGLFSALAGRVLDGKADGMDAQLFTFVTDQLEGARNGPIRVEPLKEFDPDEDIPSFDGMLAEIYDPALDERVVRAPLRGSIREARPREAREQNENQNEN